ncbi:MAG: hypothetical protein ABL930_03840 [Pseudobdellovibrio sp.]
MKSKKLKTPSDYPQFYCRMSKNDMDDIESSIVSILNKRKRKVKKGELQPKRNEIIVEAIKFGLEKLSNGETYT